MIEANKRDTMLYPEEDARYIEFTPEQLRALADLYLAGWSTYKLSRRYGISPTTVARRLEAMGIGLRSSGNRVVTADVVETAHRMRQEGKPWRSIVKVTGVRERSIMRAIRSQREKVSRAQ